MQPQEALDILNTATGQVNANREVHLRLIEAVQVLQLALDNTLKETPKED